MGASLTNEPTGAEERADLVRALASAAAGDRQGLAAVYRLTSAKLFGVCLRILKDRAESEDVLQEVYLTLWRGAGVFDPGRGTSPIAWLAAIARNRAIDRLRSLPRSAHAALEEAPEPADPNPSAEQALEKSEGLARLQACLDTLEERTRRAIRAAFFEGLTYQSLAARAATPLGTMKSWIRRGLIQLRSCLEP
ncbi:MAG: sigma-70 family RNA polymerase sigma factor [Caulobacteraceae bacterium]